MHLNDILEFFGVGTPDPTTWEPMISRANQSIWVALYIALLAVGIYHALYGLRGIIVELAPSARTTRIVTFAIIASGIIFFIGGTYVPIALLSS
jgi:succinate dehydrogenase hydrophobic anchor subunit